MDPYELFGTPPGEMVMSSTPTKPTKSRAKAGSAKKCLKSSNQENNISKTRGSATKKKKQTRRKKKSENLWDKCIKTNPELAQFVDNFNQSLEEATSKPLDMSGKE